MAQSNWSNDLFREADERTIVSSARNLMTADENAALVTVDSQGQPRVRSVRAFLEEFDADDPIKSLTVWVMTRITTRKIEQIRRHPQVTLFFDDDDAMSYLSLMGEAIVHTDPDNEGAKRIYDAEYAAFFWPDFPEDFVMLEIQPRWLEFMGPDVPNHPEHWRPQGIDLGGT